MTARQVVGLDLISEIDGAENEEYFLYDGPGSTRQLADGSGSVFICGLSIAAGGIVVYGGGVMTYQAFRPWRQPEAAQLSNPGVGPESKE